MPDKRIICSILIARKFFKSFFFRFVYVKSYDKTNTTKIAKDFLNYDIKSQGIKDIGFEILLF